MKKLILFFVIFFTLNSYTVANIDVIKNHTEYIQDVTVRLYVQGNYFFVKVGSNDAIGYHKNTILIRKVGTNRYTVIVNNNVLEPRRILFSNIADENGNAFSSQSAFESWYRSNTGFSIAGGSAVPTQDHIFENAAARDSYFNTPDPHLDELITGTPIFVGNVSLPGGGTGTALQEWGGVNNPTTYNNTDWVSGGLISNSAAQIKTLYESNANTNAFTDSYVSLLNMINAVSSNTIPIKTATGYGNSSLTENTNNIVSTKSIVTPDGSLFLGSQRLSNAGYGVLLTDMATGVSSYPVGVDIQTSGSSDPFYWKFGGLVDTPAAADKSENFTGTSIQFITPSTSSGFALSYTFDSNVNVNDVNLTIRLNSHTDPNPLFDYKRATGGVGFNMTTGENTLTLPVPQFFEQGQVLYVSVTSTNNLSLKGQTISGQTVPYIRTSGRAATKTTVLDSDDITNFGSRQIITTSERTKLTSIEVGAETNPDLGYNAYGARNITSSTIPSGSIVISDGLNDAGGGRSQVSVLRNKGQETTLRSPFGVMVKSVNSFTDSDLAVIDRGGVNIIQSGLTLTLGSDVYLGTSGIGQNEHWVFSATGNIKIGNVREVVNAVTGSYEIDVNFITADLRRDLNDKIPITTPVEGGNPRTIRSIQAGTNITISGTGNNLLINSIDKERFRGSFSTTATYAAGDIVKSFYNLETAYFIAESALQPSTITPENRLDTQQWFLLTDRTWRGSWTQNRFVPGQIVTHSGNVWMSVSNIAPTVNIPPSSTNTSWVQIDGSGNGGGGTSPNLVYVRDASRTLPNNTSDNTFVSVETTGTAIVPITLPDATASNVGTRVTVLNSRSVNEGRVTVGFGTGDSVEELFDTTIELLAGQAVTLVVRDNNLWNIVSQAETELTPNFPPNPNNDDNTFMFGVNGDSPTTYNRDNRTTINLNVTSGVRQQYEIANPATNGITVVDGDGYVFRNIGTTNWAIFPFASSNTVVIDGNTITSTSFYELLPNRTLILIYDSTDNRWEGKTINFLTPLGSSGSGASGQSGMAASSSGVTGSKIDIVAKNGEGETSRHGQLVHFIGKDGEQEFVHAGLAQTPSGVLIGDTAEGSDGFVRIIGKVLGVPVFDSSSNEISTVLSNNTSIYAKGEVGEDFMITNDSESGTHALFGHIIGSRIILNSEIGRNLGTDYQNAASGEVQLSLNKVNDFTGQGTSTFHLPTGYQEGIGGFTEVVDGVKIIIEITPDSGQNGIVNVRPGPNALMKNKSNESISYTSSSPLSMNSSLGKQIRLFEYRASDNTWLAYDNSQGIALHDYFFSIDEYTKNSLGTAVTSTMASVNTNSNDINILKRDITRPSVANNIYNITGTNIQINTVYAIQGSDSDKTVNIGAANDSGWGLTQNNTARFAIENTLNRWVKVVNNPANGNFHGMGTDTFWLKPYEYREFRIVRDGSVYRVEVLGRVSYNFSFEKGLLTSGVWLQETDLPSELIAPDATQTERLVFKSDCTINRMQLSVNWTYSATTATDFSSIQIAHPNANISKNGTNVYAGHGVQIINMGSKSEYQEMTVHRPLSFTANEYVTLSGSDLTNVTGTAIVLQGEIILKRN